MSLDVTWWGMKDCQTTAIDSYKTCTCSFNGLHTNCGTFGFEMLTQRHWHWSGYSGQSFTVLTCNSDCLQAPSPKQFPGLVVSLCTLVFWIYHTHPHQSKVFPEQFWKSNKSKKMKKNSWPTHSTWRLCHCISSDLALQLPSNRAYAGHLILCHVSNYGMGRWYVKHALLCVPAQGFSMGCSCRHREEFSWLDVLWRAIAC